MSVDNTKASIRQHLLERRTALSGNDINSCSKKIIRHILSCLSIYPASTIGAYLAFKGEPDITSGMHQLQQLGHRLAVPVIDSTRHGIMQFYPWQADTGLQRNRFGIDEPDADPMQQPLTAEIFDVLLIPLVGFDTIGHRLGMGGGYYDRWLADADPEKPERIGIAYSWQQLAYIPFEATDQPVHRVITDQGIINCKVK